MRRIAAFAYGILCYALFLAVFLYLIGFVGDFLVPKSIDSGSAGSVGTALLVNVGLLSLFAVQHSVMARGWFKKWWTKLVPGHVERSTYVLAASLVLALVMWQWRPIPTTVWSVEAPTAVAVLHGLFWAGWAVVLLSTFLIDHFRLFGLSQVWSHLRGRELEPPKFQTPALYRYVRHPLYLGFLLAFWCTPEMSVGHTLFAGVWTGWILLAIQLEERDLVRFYGDRYREYRQRVRMLLPIPRGSGSAASRAVGDPSVGTGGPSEAEAS